MVFIDIVISPSCYQSTLYLYEGAPYAMYMLYVHGYGLFRLWSVSSYLVISLQFVSFLVAWCLSGVSLWPSLFLFIGEEWQHNLKFMCTFYIYSLAIFNHYFLSLNGESMRA